MIQKIDNHAFVAFIYIFIGTKRCPILNLTPKKPHESKGQ
jgi:hypothetical protein